MSVQQLIAGGSYTKLSYNYGRVYAGIQGEGTWNHSATYGQFVPVSGTLKNLRVYLSGAAGSGDEWQFTIESTSGVGDLYVVIADAETEGSDLINTMHISAGQWIRLRTGISGTPNLVFAYATMDFEPDADGGENLVMSYPHQNVQSGQSVGYCAVLSGWDYCLTSTVAKIQVIPTDGVFDNFYFGIVAVVGSGKSITATLMVNGVESDITATISEGEYSASDLVHSVNVYAGDLVQIKITKSDTAGWAYIYHGICFTPDIKGESIIMGAPSYGLSGGSTGYHAPCGNNYEDWEAESLQIQKIPETYLGKLYVHLHQDPNDVYNFALRVAGGYTGVACSITSPSQDGHDNENEGEANHGDDFSIRGTSTPAAVAELVGWGIVLNPEGLFKTKRSRAFILG